MQFYNQEDKQVQFIIETGNITKNSNVLDIGYGRGYHMNKIKELTSCNIYGVDSEQKEELENNKYSFDVFDTWQNLPQFDLIYALSPYFGQNWWNMEKLIENVTSHLLNNGYFVLDHFDFNCFMIGRKFQNFKLLQDKVILSEYTRKEGKMDCQRITINKKFEKEVKELTWRVFETKEELENIFNQYNLSLKGFAYNYEPNLNDKISLPKITRISSVWQKK
jgi:SAM-dependent methyltransferase